MADKRYVLIKGRAGLGNRILGAASGLLYAQLMCRRPIADWLGSSYTKDRELDHTNLFHYLFDSTRVADVDEIPSTSSVAPPIWEGRLHDRAPHLPGEWQELTAAQYWRLSSVDPTLPDLPHGVVVWWSLVSAVEWMRPHMPEAMRQTDGATLLREVMRRDMRPRREIQERIDRFRDERLGGEPAVGVHVRLTDKRSRLRAIERRVRQLRDADPSLRVLVATDNRAVRDHFASRWDAVSTPHWYPEPGHTMHMNPDHPDPREGAVEALVDMHLLASCDHVVGDGTSSFFRCAEVLTAGHCHDERPWRGRWQDPAKRAWGRASVGPARPLAMRVARSFRR